MPTEIEQLYREHRAGLVRLVERELRDRHDAEDVVQTAFLDAQRAIERGTVPRNPRPWLAAIALNAARRLRRRRLNAEPLAEYAVEEASGASELRAALTSLPREQRAAVLYRDVLGLSYGETAEQMGRSVNAVTMLLHRGRRRLRQALGVTTIGVGPWRWLKQGGVSQAAVVKGAAALAVASGLATTGVVAARVAAPIGADETAVAVATRVAAGTSSGSPAARARRMPAGGLVTAPTRRQSEGGAPATADEEPAATQGPRGGSSPAPTGRSSTAAVPAPSLVPAKLPVPTVSLPTLSMPTSPVTVATTVSATTPITTVTVSTPGATTATVSTPITTVTLPLP